VTLRWELFVGAGTPPPPPQPPVGRIAEIEPSVADQNLREKVDHVVVLMLENRSFDHMLGYLSLTGGRTDVHGLTGSERNSHHRPERPGDESQDCPRPTDDDGRPIVGTFGPQPFPDSTFPDDPPHDVCAVALQVNRGAMNGFVDEFAHARASQPETIMNYHTGDQVPVYDFIARQFLLCDGYHSSFAGNTWVNRTISLAGKPATRPNGEVITNNDMPALHGAGVPSLFRTIDSFNATRQPGDEPVDWRFYSQDVPTLPIVDPQYKDELVNPTQSRRFRSLNRFFDDLAAGDLPQVSWLDPNFMDVGAFGDSVFTPDDSVSFPGSPQNANDDHPPVDIAHGQAMITSLIFAMMDSPIWEKLLFVIVYDEHGGFFDHVKPPELSEVGATAEAPDFRDTRLSGAGPRGLSLG
jgi:phospholipase C